MSRQINKTLVGGFVVGAIALVVLALVIFGSGKFFQSRRTYVMYFEGSVKGLSVGSPVNFKGVPIGEVTEIHLQFNPENLRLKIPVMVQFIRERIEGTNELGNPEKIMKRLIEKGLRAQLKMQSLITGQLMIELDFYENRPAVYLGDGKTPEIPTVPSSIEELSRTLANVPFDQIAEKLTKSIEGIERIINSPDLSSTLKSLTVAIQDIQTLVRNVDSKIGPLSTEYSQLGKNLNQELDRISESVTKTLAAAEKASAQAGTLMQKTADITSEGSPVMYQLTRTMQDLAAASRSMRALTDYYEQHPESLLRGKSRSEE